VSRFRWPNTARALHARAAARDAAEGRERICFLDNGVTCLTLIGCPDSYHFNY